MCLSCGCGEPEADHGDGRNFTMADLTAAADAAGITPEEAVKNIQETAGKA